MLCLRAVFDVLCRAKYVLTKSRFYRANPELLTGVKSKARKLDAYKYLANLNKTNMMTEHVALDLFDL